MHATRCRSYFIPSRKGSLPRDCRPRTRPVYVDGDTPKLYVRTGVSTRELNVQEAMNYTSARWKR